MEKRADPGGTKTTDPFECPNLCFMGASVVSGFATGVIVHTGARTTFGQLAQSIVGERQLTSFDKGINRFTWLMIRFIMVMVPAVFLINGLTKGDWLEALLFSVAVGVGLAPEMLPMIVTVNLAKGAMAMAKRRVIVKRLHAIQNLGAMNVLCTDKTGTLTQDRIILKRHLDIHGDDCERVLEFAYLNSHYQSGLKNLLDVAVLEHAELGRNLFLDHTYEKIDELPFDFSRRRLSVVVKIEDGSHILICKGAVEEVFSVSRHYDLNGELGELDPAHFAQAQEEMRALNEDGFRVVAVAYKRLSEPKAVYAIQDESDLTLLGYIAFLDPPKESASAASRPCARAASRSRSSPATTTSSHGKSAGKSASMPAASCSAPRSRQWTMRRSRKPQMPPRSLPSSHLRKKPGSSRRSTRVAMWWAFLATASMTVRR